MPTADDVVREHLAAMRLSRHPRYSEGTIYARERALARMAALLEVPLLEASTGDLTRWIEGLHVIDNTLVHYASHARCFYDWCVRSGYLDRNPVDDLDVPVLVRGLPRPISEADLMMAIAAAPQPVRIWLILASYCGLRCKEIALLRRESVLDTADPPVLIVTPDATKGRRGRVVPLSSFVVGELHAFGMPRAGYLFRRRDGRPGPNQPAVISHVTARFLHELGIDATAHRGRHRFGSRTYRHSRDLLLVQNLMGHADPATTAGYVEISQADAIAAVEALPVPPVLRVVSELWTGGSGGRRRLWW